MWWVSSRSVRVSELPWQCQITCRAGLSPGSPCLPVLLQLARSFGWATCRRSPTAAVCTAVGGLPWVPACSQTTAVCCGGPCFRATPCKQPGRATTLTALQRHEAGPAAAPW